MIEIPPERLYTEEHEWVLIEDEYATMGITAYAQEQLGDVVYVELPEVGRQVKRMEEFAVVESVKAASDIYSPLSGEVVEVNETLDNAPELLNKDPYGAGWICRIKLADPNETEKLLLPEDYRNQMEQN